MQHQERHGPNDTSSDIVAALYQELQNERSVRSALEQQLQWLQQTSATGTSTYSPTTAAAALPQSPATTAAVQQAPPAVQANNRSQALKNHAAGAPTTALHTAGAPAGPATEMPTASYCTAAALPATMLLTADFPQHAQAMSAAAAADSGRVGEAASVRQYHQQQQQQQCNCQEEQQSLEQHRQQQLAQERPNHQQQTAAQMQQSRHQVNKVQSNMQGQQSGLDHQQQWWQQQQQQHQEVLECARAMQSPVGHQLQPPPAATAAAGSSALPISAQGVRVLATLTQLLAATPAAYITPQHPVPPATPSAAPVAAIASSHTLSPYSTNQSASSRHRCCRCSLPSNQECCLMHASKAVLVDSSSGPQSPATHTGAGQACCCGCCCAASSSSMQAGFAAGSKDVLDLTASCSSAVAASMLCDAAAAQLYNSAHLLAESISCSNSSSFTSEHGKASYQSSETTSAFADNCNISDRQYRKRSLDCSPGQGAVHAVREGEVQQRSLPAAASGLHQVAAATAAPSPPTLPPAATAAAAALAAPSTDSSVSQQAWSDDWHQDIVAFCSQLLQTPLQHQACSMQQEATNTAAAPAIDAQIEPAMSCWMQSASGLRTPVQQQRWQQQQHMQAICQHDDLHECGCVTVHGCRDSFTANCSSQVAGSSCGSTAILSPASAATASDHSYQGYSSPWYCERCNKKHQKAILQDNKSSVQSDHHGFECAGCCKLREMLLECDFECELAQAQLAAVVEQRDLLSCTQQSLLGLLPLTDRAKFL